MRMRFSWGDIFRRKTWRMSFRRYYKALKRKMQTSSWKKRACSRGGSADFLPVLIQRACADDLAFDRVVVCRVRILPGIFPAERPFVDVSVAAFPPLAEEIGGRERFARQSEKDEPAEADNEQNYYLNIGSDSKGNEPLTFAIERDGETIAMTSSRITYAPNQVLGTPDEPTAINFTALDEMPHDGKWYTVSGIRLEKKPTVSGLYIYNGQVVFIK